jgi:glycosyltransferase involved in cell wall biosynthesis
MPVLSIVIPVYNEINTIEELLRRVANAPLPDGISKEIIIVDDSSKDGTREFLKKLDGSYKVIFHEKNRGKGAAVRTGLKHATGDFVIIQDADLEYNPDEIKDLLKPILEGKADVVYGSRFMSGRPHAVLRFWHYVGNKILTMISNAFTNLYLTDMETCYKLFTRKVVDDIGPKLVSNRFDIEPEITARIAKAGYRVFEVGISYGGRTKAEGKKIGWKDGFQAIWAIIKYNLCK